MKNNVQFHVAEHSSVFANKSSTSITVQMLYWNSASGLCFEICYFCCHLLIAVLWSFYFFPAVPWHLGCPRAVPWSLGCLPAVLGSCDILPVDLLALVALWPQKAVSAVNHATFPIERRYYFYLLWFLLNLVLKGMRKTIFLPFFLRKTRLIT